MGTQPLISVCIPCYNGERFIGRTLESVLHQTFDNFELLISDNHSTDDSVSVIQSYRDPRIKLVPNESNLGLEANWNKVLSMSSGKYVKILCADDVLYPECLSRQIQVLEDPSYGQATLAVCNRHVIDAQDEVILRRKLPLPCGLISGQKLIRACVRSGTNLIGEPVVGLFRRDVLSRIGTWAPANLYVIDLAFWAELLKHGDAFVDPTLLAAFRVSAEGVSANIGLQQAACFRQFIQSLHRNGFYSVGRLEMLSGCVFSLLRCFLRNVFLRWHVSQTPKSQTRNTDSSCSAGATRFADPAIPRKQLMSKPLSGA